MNKKISTILLAFVFISLLSAAFIFRQDENTQGIASSVAKAEAENATSHENPEDYLWDDSEAVSINLNRDSISAETNKATINGSTVTIISAGTYKISGTLADGQIIVDTEDKEVIRLILAGVNVNNSKGAPIYIKSAKEVIIALADNTENYLSDEKTYVFENGEDEPNAVLFSKADLTIYGENGNSLTIAGNYNDGISSKDGLIIKNATINLTAVDDGIRGKDYVVVENSSITVSAGSNGLKSDNDTDASMGYISIEDSVIKVVSGGDAITAETDAIVTNSEFNLTSGGGSGYGAAQDVSKKGIKALVSLMIESGNFTINSADDALHSNGKIVINSGTFAVSSGDDAVHADSSTEINGGNIDITKSFEGIESAIVTINDGNINIFSSDDGINIAGGNDGSAMGRPGAGGFDPASNNYYLYINGGYLYINANGDGLDSNGSIAMTGGTVIIDGPIRNDNGALDYLGTFNITDGFLIGVGSSGMAEAPSQSSSQYSVLVNFDAVQSAGSLINIQTSSGQNILTFAPEKQYQSVVFSSADLKDGETYLVYLGGSSTGTETNGLYGDGIYSPGNQNSSFTISAIVTNIGTGGMQGGGMRGGMPGNMRRW